MLGRPAATLLAGRGRRGQGASEQEAVGKEEGGGVSRSQEGEMLRQRALPLESLTVVQLKDLCKEHGLVRTV